jgi:KDO2-lipid IV(A) lauroyltransferase
MKTNFKDALLYSLFRKIIYGLSSLPSKTIVKPASLLGYLWFRLDAHHRNIAISNIRHAYGKTKDRQWIYKTAAANFKHLVKVALELPSLLTLNRENLDTFATFEGVAHVEKAAAEGKGALLFSAHLGNWELMALAMSLKFSAQSHLLVRPLDFKPMDRILSELRSRTGNILLDKIRSANTIGRILQAKASISIMFDQNASWYDGVYVPFFNQIACTNRGLALFAMRYDAIVIPVFNLRRPDGRYKIMIDPPVPIVRTGDINHDMMENSARFNKIIEKYIRMAPDNWFWVHRRWRLKPVPEKIRKKLAPIVKLGAL